MLRKRLAWRNKCPDGREWICCLCVVMVQTLNNYIFFFLFSRIRLWFILCSYYCRPPSARSSLSITLGRTIERDGVFFLCVSLHSHIHSSWCAERIDALASIQNLDERKTNENLFSLITVEWLIWSRQVDHRNRSFYRLRLIFFMRLRFNKWD